jgi:site-specific DNA-methyltransferase (adenine-specific)
MGSPLGKTLLPNHYGILYYVKSDDFKFYDIRMLHRRCRNCHYILQDYGGKKSQMHPFGPLVSDVWTDIHRIRHKKRRDEHPCQLPIHLLERLLLMSTDEEDIVLDPFIGTGTTAIAAKKLGRKFIGIDIDTNYVEITNKKLEEAEPTVINGCYVSNFLGHVITVRDKDWEKIKDAFVIPTDPLELEKREIYLLHKKGRTIKYDLIGGIQRDLFSIGGEKE